MRKTPKDSVMANPWVGLAMAFVMVPLILLFYKPSFWEFFGFLVIDFLAFQVMGVIDIRIFQKIAPQTAIFFPELDFETLARQSHEQRSATYRAMLGFPKLRCIYVLIASLFKAVPALAFVYKFWTHDSDASIVFFKTLSICAFFYSYQFGLTFIEYHTLLSRSLRTIHDRFNWSDVFRNDHISVRDQGFYQVEMLCASSVWFFWVILLVFIVSDRQLSPVMAALQTVYVSTCGLCLVGQIFISSKRLVTQGISALIAYDLDSKLSDQAGIALSTYPILSFYQRVLNKLIERNAISEKEIHHWIYRRAESNRYLDLGRIAGLMVHDLMTPLTVMRHCLNELEKIDESRSTQKTYIDRLKFCLQQITDLVTHVRSTIRNKKADFKSARPQFSHETAEKIVAYLFKSDQSLGLTFIYDLPNDLLVHIPQTDLNQVFLNLYSNAMRNMLTHHIDQPTLIVDMHDETDCYFVISLRDKGTGLSSRSFAFMTEESLPHTETEGIGLKLTKRLVEIYGGTLTVEDPPASTCGTQFLLTLKKVPEHHKVDMQAKVDGTNRSLKSSLEV